MTDELTQAAIYGDLVRRAACDPDVDEVSFFGFRDDGLRTGFQAALHRADGTPRPAAAAVQTAIEETAAGCPGTELLWTPLEEVAGARVESIDVGETQVTTRIRAGEDAQARICVRSLGAAESGWAARVTRIAVGLLGARCTTSAVVGLHPLKVVTPRRVTWRGSR